MLHYTKRAFACRTYAMRQNLGKKLKRIKIANRDDYRSFFDLHYKLFCQFANRFLNDYESSRDIVQDAMIHVWKVGSDFSDLNHMRAYSYKVIRSRCLNHLRNLRVVEKSENEIGYLNSTIHFRNVVVEEEIYSFICGKIEALPDMQRRVIEMHVKGMSNEDIATFLNITVNTVRTHKQRAKATLKLELENLLVS